MNMMPWGSLFGLYQSSDEDLVSLDNISWTTTSKVSPFRKHTNQYHLPQGYGYPPSPQPFQGASWGYHHSPFNMTCSSQPSTCASEGFPRYGPKRQGYGHHQSGYGGSQMFPPLKISGQWLSSRGEPGVPPGLLGIDPVNRPTTSSYTAPPGPPTGTAGTLSGASGKPPVSLQMKRIQAQAELRITAVAGIADLPWLLEISQNEYKAEVKCEDSSDLGVAEGKASISLKQTEFSLKQFGKKMGQPNYIAFNKWKKVSVAGFMEKEHRSIILGQSCFIQLRDGPQH